MTTDQAAAREFYSALFGWHVDVGPEETGHYGMASLGGRSVAGIGGMMGMDHPPVWNTYLAVTDVDQTCKQIEAAGGSVMAPPMDVMEFGRMAFAGVPSGGVFGLWQAGTHTGVGLANETGALTWNEFLTRDVAGAKAFYAEVFGYTYSDVGDDYVMVEVDGNTVGGLGAMPPGLPEAVPPHWRVYFAVDDCDAAAAKVVELGGKVLRQPEDMPYGRHADVADPQGAPFAIIKPAAG
jgi:predicted enzyme related to lactoylglutathione lyase